MNVQVVSKQLIKYTKKYIFSFLCEKVLSRIEIWNIFCLILTQIFTCREKKKNDTSCSNVSKLHRLSSTSSTCWCRKMMRTNTKNIQFTPSWRYVQWLSASKISVAVSGAFTFMFSIAKKKLENIGIETRKKTGGKCEFK